MSRVSNERERLLDGAVSATQRAISFKHSYQDWLVLETAFAILESRSSMRTAGKRWQDLGALVFSMGEPFVEKDLPRVEESMRAAAEAAMCWWRVLVGEGTDADRLQAADSVIDCLELRLDQIRLRRLLDHIVCIRWQQLRERGASPGPHPHRETEDLGEGSAD